MTVTTSVTRLHNLHTSCAAMGIADGGEVDEGGSKDAKGASDTIFEQGGDITPSGSSSTAEYDIFSVLTPAPPSVKGGI